MLVMVAALLVLTGLALVSVCLIVVARTTMVAWITVLVLLAFSGKLSRRILANDGRRITADVAMHLIKVMVKECRFPTAICAAVVSVLAMVQVTRI